MSSHIMKSFSPPLALISAAFLIHIGAAVAADSTGDPQQQMRELLAGRIATHSELPSAGPGSRGPTADVQELARRLLLGITDLRVEGAEALTGPENAAAPGTSTLKKALLVHEDAQAMARRLLLGRQNDAPAGS